eukprot:scaffold339899_cov15-Prasinocladus_malaysianus.AAC.1
MDALPPQRHKHPDMAGSVEPNCSREYLIRPDIKVGLGRVTAALSFGLDYLGCRNEARKVGGLCGQRHNQ